MTTPSIGLLSFRKSVTRIVKNNSDDDDDDDDGGWVHGGKYVPASSRSALVEKQSTPASNAPPAGATTTPGGGVSNNNMPSPYSMLSPPALNTPLPQETAASSQQQQQPASTPQFNSTRTPMTVQLQRLLHPSPTPQQQARTPANIPAEATTPTAVTVVSVPIANNTPLSTPRQRGLRHHALPPATPVEKFLQQSGVTPSMSHTLSNVAYHFTYLVFSIMAVVWTYITVVANGIASWLGWAWNKLMGGPMGDKFLPNFLRDVVDTLYECTVEGYQFVYRIVQFVAPCIRWIIQTVIALVLAVGGTIMWCIDMVFRGRKKADGSGVASVKGSAIKSLRDSVRKVRDSPFVKRSRSRLPFSGFSDSDFNNDQQQRQPTHQMANARAGVQATLASSIAAASTSFTQMASSKPPPANNARSSTTATPPISAIRNLKQTPRALNATAHKTVNTPATANTRRVLFSTTKHGEVSTEPFYYDKTMPASARKADPRSRTLLEEEEEETMSPQVQVQERFDNTPPRREEAATATVDSNVASPAVLRPSKYSERHVEDVAEKESLETASSRTSGSSIAVAASSEHTTRVNTQRPQPTERSQPRVQPRLSRPPSVNNSKNNDKPQQAQPLTAEEEETKKQQYIQRYGLLPTITPLSKRYGRRMQQQKQKPASITNGPTGTTNATDAAGETKKTSTAAPNHGNVKRKRRGDLLGAASRLGRHRRARLTTTTRNTSSALNNGTLLGRSRTPKRRREDDVSNTSRKRTEEWVLRAMNHDGKENLVNDLQPGSVAKRGKFTSANDSAESVVGTPPKNPTALFSGQNIMTPPKTPGANFPATPAPKKSGDTAAGAAVLSNKQPPSFAFGGANKDAGAASTSAAAAPGFSFGASAAPPAEKKDAAPAAAFAFGATTAPAAAPVPTAGVEKKDASAPGFSFGASAPAAAPAVSEKKDAAPSAPGFSFGGATAPAPAAAAPASFGFGASSQPAPATKHPAPSSGAGFSFGTGASGAATAAVPAAAAAPTPGSFAFGAGGTPAAPAPAMAVAAAAPTPATFGFGAGGTPATAPTATTAPAPAAFGFGASSQPTPAAAMTNQPVPPAGAAFAFGTGVGGVPASTVAGFAPAAAATTPAAFGFGAGATPAPAAAAPTPAAFGFGASSQPAPASLPASGGAFAFGTGAATAVAAPAVATPGAFSFGTSAAPPAAAAPSTFAFGASAGAPAPPNFGAAAPANNSFGLGGAAAPSGGGASARRRAKASGRRR
eukprot:CAMPEP_0172322896 /NCGR_PEP_ID=MMETSP1058-20130122/47231_1 /TAXON_ID=83371 /ORGANISM="Detonula confervacea, Strain CCMP 353" /LENGTH=1246 /DNA_ID=CAMNT_0013038763 /DNA_START=1 /DNA_END=3741 /DNA_ORIENTATION=-